MVLYCCCAIAVFHALVNRQTNSESSTIRRLHEQRKKLTNYQFKLKLPLYAMPLYWQFLPWRPNTPRPIPKGRSGVEIWLCQMDLRYNRGNLRLISRLNGLSIEKERLRLISGSTDVWKDIAQCDVAKPTPSIPICFVLIYSPVGHVGFQRLSIQWRTYERSTAPA
jgi:hypothetical protein